MALVIIFAVLSQFDFVAKFTVKNLNIRFKRKSIWIKSGSEDATQNVRIVVPFLLLFTFGYDPSFLQ